MNLRVRSLVFLGALATATLAPPLQLALGVLDFDKQGIAAREAQGSIWSGTLRGASWDGRALGDLDVGLRPFSLLAGTRVIAIAGDGFAIEALSGRTIGVDAVDGVIKMAGAPLLPGLQAELGFTGVAVVFQAGYCKRATGRVQARLRWEAPAEGVPILLSGTPECAGRTAVLPLRSEAGSAGIEAELRLEADGGYRLQILVRDADLATSLLLHAAGFMDAQGGLSHTLDGRLGN